jgi:hypothetical protein
MFYGFPANLGFSVAFVRYVLDVYGFPANFRVFCCVLFVMCWMFMVSLQILEGLGCVLFVMCWMFYGFPAKF